MRCIATLFTFFIVHFSIFALPTHHIESEPKITVIGAGLAGLTAAYRLQKMGHLCEIYEARNRPGGRVFTAYFGETYEELGGKNVYDGGSGKNILALIDELGLETLVHPVNFSQLTILEGKMYSHADLFQNAPKPNGAAFLLLKEKIDAAKNLADLINPFLKENKLLQSNMNFCMASWEGCSPDALAPEYIDDSFHLVYNWIYRDLEDLSLGKQPQFTFACVRGGNSQLIARLAEKLERKIHYNKPLRKISRSTDQKIWLHFDHESLWTDYLILALPCSTLNDVVIEEGIFPEDQLLAIRTLQYGTNAKLLFPIQGANDPLIEWVLTDHWHVFFNKDHSVMTWYCGGQGGIFNPRSSEKLSEIVEKELPNIYMAFPKIIFPKGLTPLPCKEQLFAQYDQPVAISWINEEFSKGGYSNYAPGTYAFFNTFIDEWEESVRKVFRCIDGRIFFAGEHTAPKNDNGTMDGAVYSGERAARMVDRALSASVLKKHY